MEVLEPQEESGVSQLYSQRLSATINKIMTLYLYIFATLLTVSFDKQKRHIQSQSNNSDSKEKL